MGICETCSVALARLRNEFFGPRGQIELVHPQHDASTRKKCWICAKYALWLEEEYPEIFGSWKVKPLSSLCMPSHTGFTVQNGKRSRKLFLSFMLCPQNNPGEHGKEISVSLISTKGVSTWVKYTHNINGIEDFEEYTTPSPLVSSSANQVPLIRHWMDECSQKHDRCLQQQKIVWHPTRLLYLDPQTKSVRLIITKGNPPDGPYMTLSHRWGAMRYTVLTSPTLAAFMNDIDITGLPQCFQEAIDITRTLGIRYLWIDSLCIKQDKDMTDWKVESQLMGKVYSHSFLNISATLSHDDTTSLHSQQNLDVIRPTRLDIPIRTRLRLFKVGALSQRLFKPKISRPRYWIVDNDLWDDEINQAPLQSRGWVFQERLLAPRVLHFTSHQIAWECYELNALELFPARVPLGMIGMITKDALSKMIADRGQSPSGASGLGNAWKDIVEQYTRTQLTFSKDKLIAFAGIAKEIEAKTNDLYFAGLWKSTFIYDLAWTRTPYDSQQNPLRNSRNRAPTWSWMSTDGEVLSPGFNKSARQLARVTEFPPLALAGSSATEASGAIRLRGVSVPLNSIALRDGDISTFTLRGLCFENDFQAMNSCLDLEGSVEEMIANVDRGIELMPLFLTREHMHAIAVSLVDKTGCSEVAYHRVGACKIRYLGLRLPKQGPSFEGFSTNFIEDKTQSNLEPYPRAVELISYIVSTLRKSQHLEFKIY